MTWGIRIFQLAMVASRIILIGYDSATAQSEPVSRGRAVCIAIDHGQDNREV
jgi:hypothetical protein